MASDFEGQVCGIYPRVSSERQAEDDKTSLGVQEANCRDYAAKLGMVVDEACVRLEAHTATESDRPELNRLLDDMVQRGVPNLIIDRADRLTRAGQLAAALFLQRFVDSGITLHVASMDLVVHDWMGVMQFLNLAFAAHLDNSYRAARARENRKALATEKGRYARGNRAPYGWRYVVEETDKQGRWKKFHIEPDDDEHGGTHKHLLKMIRLRQQGLSWVKIADTLTVEGVMPPRLASGEANASPVWSHLVVRYLVRNPMNWGKATSFKWTREWRKPDAKHPKRWRTSVRVPEDQQVELPTGTVIGAPLTLEEAESIRKLGTRIAGPEPSSPWLAFALLRGGVAKCAMPGPNGPCGGTLIVRSPVRRSDGAVYLNYSCRRHGVQPRACPGLTVSAGELDNLVWEQVRGVLLTEGALEALAEEQAACDARSLPTSSLAQLRRTRKQLAAKCDNLRDAIKNAPSAFVRGGLMSDLARLEPAIEDADRQIGEAEAIARDEARRREVLADVQLQVGRYKEVLELGESTPDEIDDRLISMRAAILQALGTKVTVLRLPDYTLDVHVEFELRRGRVVPWFLTPEYVELRRDSATGRTLLESLSASPLGKPNLVVRYTPAACRSYTKAEGTLK